jgi:radical SAM enzyme (TIGR01210 family)
MPLRTARPYPASGADRDRWITERRGARNDLDPSKPYAFFTELERSLNGELVAVATLFLTNRECPWKCVFCDLWKNTVPDRLPAGAIPSQIDYALSRLAPASHIKLYNSGSFFDRRAIPPADRPAIAQRVASFERVIIECHPGLVNEEAVKFRDAIGGKLEVAMGLETVHPIALEKLNKRMTLEQFAHAAEFLRRHGIDLRAFILIQPPFVPAEESQLWTERSVDFALQSGATVCSLIPTRSDNGALEALADAGDFSEPRLHALERAVEYGVSLQAARVFADLWDLERFAQCRHCFPARLQRLRLINETQVVPEPVQCVMCATTPNA